MISELGGVVAVVVVVVGGGGERLGFTFDYYLANAGTNTHTTTGYQFYAHLLAGLFRLALLMVCFSVQSLLTD